MNEQQKVARYSPHGYSVGMRAEHEGLYVTYADYDQLRQRLADAEEARERAYDNRDMALQAADHEKTRAEQAEAKLALAEQLLREVVADRCEAIHSLGSDLTFRIDAAIDGSQEENKTP